MSKAETARGFFDHVKEYGVDLYTKAQTSQNSLLAFVVSFGMGFVSGFLLKRYAHHLFAFVLFVIGLIVLQQTGFITITWNVAKLEQLFGIQPVTVTSDFASVIWSWIQLNVGVTVSFIVGLMVGLRLA